MLDKVSGRVFYPRVEDFGVEDFHTFSREFMNQFGLERTKGLEELIGELFESPASPLLAKIVDNSRLPDLNTQERQQLVRFMALQFVRTPGHIFNLQSSMAKVLDKPEPKRSLRVLGTPSNPDPMRDRSLAAMPVTADALADVLKRAHLALLVAPSGVAAIGDNPVVVQMRYSPPPNLHGMYSVSAPGSDAFLPISPMHILYLHTDCNAVAGEIGKTIQTPKEISDDALNYLNALQANNAVRYVVFPKKGHEAQLVASLSRTQTNYYNFKSAFN